MLVQSPTVVSGDLPGEDVIASPGLSMTMTDMFNQNEEVLASLRP